MDEKLEVILDAYRKHLGVHISRAYKLNGRSIIEVGNGHALLTEHDSVWFVARRWVQAHPGGLSESFFDWITEEDGGGKFTSLEAALRTALNFWFDEQINKAWSEVGEYEQENDR